MEPIIEFKNYSFKYRSQVEPTLRDINLKIYPGEKVLIIGPSGSGKSTLANCINGLVPFSYAGDVTGTLTVEGKDASKLGIFGLAQMVGTVMQDTDGQFVGLTVAEDIAFSLENACIEQEQMKKKVNEVARMVDVSALLHHAPSEMSGGQKQRVAIAGVMVDDVDILLFDEPLANLDPATGKRAIELIDRIKKQENKTVLIIEHRLEDALYKEVDRVILVGDGCILADMKPDELLATGILKDHGIREPLYITALKHAGCTIRPEDCPGNIKTMNFEPYREKVQVWFENYARQKPVISEQKVLQVEKLDFAYAKDTPVLSGISFSVQKGEMLAVIGKNGAGKTTLSNLICGFLKPDAGAIYLNGDDIAPLSIKERGEKIGLVMQNPNQMISKSVIFDEVALGLAVRGVPDDEIKERVNQTLKICGLYPFRNWPIAALSFGQKKRVTIASILVMQPEIMILDEPTAGQDYYHYTEIMEFIRQINAEYGITIIMITHDMHLMLEYTNRAVVIADGSLLSIDTPAAILTDETLANQANLKKTSLYDMALACGIENTSAFVEHFISYERAYVRKAGAAADISKGGGSK
jgi:energy-coupling factor transport system ATP-binding protein